jgi:hypothetical protein
MTRRNSRVEGELELAEATALSPFAQKTADVCSPF